MTDVSPEALRNLLIYEPDTGRLFWKSRPDSMFTGGGSKSAAHVARTWNTRYANHTAFTYQAKSGYLSGRVFGKLMYAHRAIWAIQTGQSAPPFIDHVDGDPSNNRWLNLRAATRAENMQSMQLPSNSTSGVKGVSWRRNERKWIARVVANGKANHLGYFCNLAEAESAVRIARNRLHGEFARQS